MTHLVNLTPHVVSIINDAGDIRDIRPRQISARVKSKSVYVGEIDGVPFYETVFGEVENLPDYEYGWVYIVSQIVIAACPNRTDLVRPDTGSSCVRDSEGRIVAVRALTR